ncbi:MAG: DUF3160 domain-containing protein [Planctomycetes bacterium]|nr:DUF3160 domain-containing protein [Planctomycetota bacterium]
MKKTPFLALLLAAIGLLHAKGLSQDACLDLKALPPVSLSPEDAAFLDDFGAVLRSVKGMTLAEFERDHVPGRSYRVAANEKAFLRGDGNLDGRVDLSDAICTLFFLFVGTGPCARPSCESALDADDTGTIDLTDALLTLQFLFLGDASIPEPYPLPGLDPTPDGLRCPNDLASEMDYDPAEAEFFPAIAGNYPLSEAQEEAYRRHGFVILDDWKFESMLTALWHVYHNDLPIYISADAILDSLHHSFDEILKELEENFLIGQLNDMLEKMESELENLESYAGGASISENLDWADFWICVARSLLRGERAPCARPVDVLVDQFLGYVAAERVQSIQLFGEPEPRDEDFSQFRPRSHYTETEALERYFRAMMWTQRIGMRFAECPGHAAVAFLLSKALLDSGAIEEWRRIDAAIKLFVGDSDSLNPPGLADLLGKTGVEHISQLYDGESFLQFVLAARETGAGRQRINSQILKSDPYNIDGFTPIPPAFHLMGQRFIADSFIFTNVVHDRVFWRALPSPLDAWFVLGNPAAFPLLRDELSRWKYHPHLAALDRIISGYSEDFWQANFYNVWLSALRTLNLDTARTPYPAVMQTEAWARRALHAQLASWSQLRHDTILYAKPSYTVGSCDYPEGWVDPYPEFYRVLSGFGASALDRLDVLDLGGGIGELLNRILRYFASLRDHARMLESIAKAELEGDELSVEQKNFIREPLFLIGQGYGGGIINGWYKDLRFQDENVFNFQPTIADVHTCIAEFCGTQILHVGTGYANLMLVSVKNACGVKCYVGPVLSYHEFVEPTIHRWTDQEWLDRLRNEDGTPPPRPDWTGDFIR